MLKSACVRRAGNSQISPHNGGEFAAGIFQKGGTEKIRGGDLSKGGNRRTLKNYVPLTRPKILYRYYCQYNFIVFLWTACVREYLKVKYRMNVSQTLNHSDQFWKPSTFKWEALNADYPTNNNRTHNHHGHFPFIPGAWQINNWRSSVLLVQLNNHWVELQHAYYSTTNLFGLLLCSNEISNFSKLLGPGVKMTFRQIMLTIFHSTIYKIKFSSIITFTYNCQLF